MEGRRYDSVCLWQPLAPLRPFAAYSHMSITDARSPHSRLTAGLDAAQASYCMSVMCVLECLCTYRGFLTSTSCVPSVALYGQNDMRHASSRAFFKTLPPSLLPAGDTKQKAGSPCSFPPARFSLSPQLQLTPPKLSTCLVRISSLEAL